MASDHLLAVPAPLQALIDRGEAWKAQSLALLNTRISLKRVSCTNCCLPVMHAVVQRLLPACTDCCWEANEFGLQPLPHAKHELAAGAARPWGCRLRLETAALPCRRVPPKWLQMRDLLNSGLRLPVEMPEVEDLRLSVKR